MDKSEKLEHAHNKGQEDAAKGEYNPPLNLLTELFATDQDRQEAKAYREGWRNTTDQKKK